MRLISGEKFRENHSVFYLRNRIRQACFYKRQSQTDWLRRKAIPPHSYVYPSHSVFPYSVRKTKALYRKALNDLYFFQPIHTHSASICLALCSPKLLKTLNP